MKISDAKKLWKDLELDGEPVDVGNGCFGRFVLVKPSQFQRWLAERNKSNRQKKEATIERYKDDIVAGRWRPTHQGICFYENGQMGDGQNRAEASVRANQPIMTLVIVGVQSENGVAFDEGRNRSFMDAATISGVEVNKLQVTTAKVIHNGRSKLTTPISNEGALALVQQYNQTLQWLDDNLKREKGITSKAIVRGAVGRAHIACKGNNQQVHILKNICSVLENGQWDKPEFGQDYEIVNKFRTYVMKAKLYGQQPTLYGMTEYVIAALLNKRNIKRLHEASGEQFPFPNEAVPVVA